MCFEVILLFLLFVCFFYFLNLISRAEVAHFYLKFEVFEFLLWLFSPIIRSILSLFFLFSALRKEIRISRCF